MPWTESAPGTIHPGSMTGYIPGDICPSDWDEDFDRAQMSTQVLIGRQLPTNIPTLTYNFPGSTPPANTELTLVDTPPTMLVSKQQAAFPPYVSAILDFIKTGDTLRVASTASTGDSLGYRVTSEPVDHGTYLEIPIFWTEGSSPPAAGQVYLTMTLTAEPPQLWIDALGKQLYGVETFNRLDLINANTDLFETLADRILEVRGVNSVPRIDSVTIDARTGPGIANMELMSSAAPERPSRYQLRLAVDERPIFDRMMFVASVRHFIARDEWTLRVGLDIAEWAAQL